MEQCADTQEDRMQVLPNDPNSCSTIGFRRKANGFIALCPVAKGAKINVHSGNMLLTRRVHSIMRRFNL